MRDRSIWSSKGVDRGCVVVGNWGNWWVRGWDVVKKMREDVYED
jgi:hypothetical protein